MDNKILSVEISRLIHEKCKDVHHDIGLQVVELIKKESEKPFNPELLGFNRFYDEHNKITGDIEYEKLFDEKLNIYYVLCYEQKTGFWSCRAFSKSDVINYKMPAFGLIKIPNHDFGVKLLKNLGVIE